MTVDFFRVSFNGGGDGYAGGAVCQEGATNTDTCPRVPVIYHYTAAPGQPPSWSKVALPSRDPAHPVGFVGAIAYLPDGRVLAVGGDGTYPRREQPSDQPDQAGMARAWLYSAGSWCELGAGSSCGVLPAGMRGMTALDCSPREGDNGLCAAGGLRQLWMWKGDRFDAHGYNDTSTDVDRAGEWRFRVRSVRFAPGEKAPPAMAVALTSGCCYVDPATHQADPTKNTGRVLLYDGQSWYVRTLFDSRGGTEHTQTLPDSYFGALLTSASNGQELSLVAAPGGQPSAPGVEPASRVVRGLLLPASPSYVPDPVGNALGLPLYTANPGGNSDLLLESSHALSPLRLVAGDGDVAGPADPTQLGGAPTGPDHTLDWAVGQWTTTGQGVAYTTTNATYSNGPFADPLPRPVACSPNPGVPPTGCQPDPKGTQAPPSLFNLPSYALNGYIYEPDTGVGWAVGDRGAIDELGGGADQASSAGGSNAGAPVLGARDPGSLPDSGAYDAFAVPPSSSLPGTVPALLSQPLRQLTQPQVVPGGVPEPARRNSLPSADVRTIVMSRDGAEGWALGSTPNVSNADAGADPTSATTLYHFNGSTWQNCDIDGISGVVPADPACSGLSALRHNPQGDSTAGNLGPQVKIVAAARVPMENAGDPARANDFEVVAIGTALADAGAANGTRYAILRYRSGRWSVDRQAMREIDPVGTFVGGLVLTGSTLAFSGPDDGWIVDAVRHSVYHYGRDHRWRLCDDSPETDCRGPASLISPTDPANNTLLSSSHVALAGGRLYLYGGLRPTSGTGLTATPPTPWLLHLDPGGQWTADNPGATSGEITALSVIGEGDRHRGWAMVSGAATIASNPSSAGAAGASLLRLGSDGVWKPWTASDASSDYLPYPSTSGWPAGLVTLDTPDASVSALLAPGLTSGQDVSNQPILEFAGRWTSSSTPFSAFQQGHQAAEVMINAMAPDNQGGAWVAVRSVVSFGAFDSSGAYVARPEIFYHYTRRVPQPVFAEVPHPVREEMTAGAAGGDGSFWIATHSGVVYRHDRVTGWARVNVPGWDPGKIVTSASEASAIAVGLDGRGVVVGKAGRIADLSPGQAVLDAAAGVVGSACQAGGACGTSSDLRAAAVAPDGSALVGGDRRALLWRQAGGEFRPIPPPQASASARVTGISLPAPDRAWLITDTGQVFAGQLTSGRWQWGPAENVNDTGQLLTSRGGRGAEGLRAIAIDGSGHGFAVGDRGVLLERTGSGAHAWRRLQTGFLDNFTSVALPTGGGPGALVGAGNGLILTFQNGRFTVSRQPDPYDGLVNSNSPAHTARIVGVGVLPGPGPREVEAWAAMQAPETGGQNGARSPTPVAVLHYSSDLREPLLNPDVRVTPLADSPVARPGELALAAFGKSECQVPAASCPEVTGSNLFNDLVHRRVAEDIATREQRPGGPAVGVYTGDVSDSAGRHASAGKLASPPDPDNAHHRWLEQVYLRLKVSGLPVFSALGGQDLSRPPCSSSLPACPAQANAGTNLGWRGSFAGMPLPWGAPTLGDGSANRSPADFGGVSYRPVATTGTEGQGAAAGAHTHYAFDMVRGDKPVARVVFVDTSLRTLGGHDALQNPAESQLKWLDDTLAGRAAGEQAVVVSETPAYSYGPGAGTDTQTDGAAFEAILLKDHVNAVISGRLGWNGLYWTTTPGLHTPCAGEDYPDATKLPAGGAAPPQCGATSGSGVPTTPDAASQLAGALTAAAAPAPPAGCSGSGDNQAGFWPTVVSSSAGGKFGPDGQAQGSADRQGFWHGYSIVRLDKSGDPRCMIVEQRAVFDWVGIQAAAHVLKPGQHVTLKGYGREPVGVDLPAQYDAINGPAITHRYDLLKADAQRPYLPATSCQKTPGNPSGYCELSDTSIGQVNPVTGAVTTGRGNHPRVYAIGLLSVGDKAASWPLVFDPRRSFVAVPPLVTSLPPAPVPPQVHVAAIAATSPPPPPSAPPPAPPSVGTPTLPQLPGLPGLPPLNSPPPAAPPPPAGAPPPAPPASQAPSALSISVSPQSVGFAPPSGVVPPPAPPINPAPPGGARREAKAKQPAAAKSAEGSSEEASDIQQSGGDTATGGRTPDGAQMTRRDRAKLGPSFTFLTAAHSHPSAWGQGALYGGSLALMALVLALGYTTVRPTPRRRRPTVGAPAWARAQRRRPWR
ncbi:MAG TPA: hypothetical protein VGN69_01450 [Solirubrobacteraceae bacterium]|nr:hypothetical protein [Solirubrobacteraceae bacterium]